MPTELFERLGPTGRLLLLTLAGAVVAAALLEGLVLQRMGRPYDWRACAASLADGLGRRAVDALGLSLAAPLLAAAHAERWTTLDMQSPWHWLALGLGVDFCYYWHHRASHRIGWFWATHSVHHSPREVTLAAALRLGWTGKLSGIGVFYTPLILLGFPPLLVLATLGANLLYQFWLHAAWIPRLGRWVEFWLNTPAHHRVHHACNPAYLDCNYGGVLIVFDRLFGSLREARADEPLRYGLTEPLDSHNPLVIAGHGWWRLARRLWLARHWGERWRRLVGPP